MSFVSFLKEAGTIILKGAQIFMGIEPVASSLLKASNPTVTGKLDSIDQMVSQTVNIEQTFAAAFGSAQTGPAKLQALIPQIQQIVLGSEALSGKKVADQDLFTKAMQEYAQATVDLLNSLHPAGSTQNPTGAPAVTPVTQPVPPVATPAPPTPPTTT